MPRPARLRLTSAAMAAVSPRGSTRARSVARPSARAASTRLNPSTTANAPSRSHTTMGMSCPRRRSDSRTARSAAGREMRSRA